MGSLNSGNLQYLSFKPQQLSFGAVKTSKNKEVQSFDSSNVTDNIQKDPAAKGKKKRGVWYTVGGSLLVGAIALITLKDFGRLRIYSENLKKKAEEISQSNPFISKALKAGSSFAQNLGDITGKLSDNINSLKDTIFDRIIRVNDNKYGTVFVKKTRNFFKSLSVSTMDSAYEKANRKMNNLFEAIGKAGEADVQKREKLKKGQILLTEALNLVEKHFGKQSRMQRITDVEQELDGFVEEVAGRLKNEKTGVFIKGGKLQSSLVTDKCSGLIEKTNNEVKNGFDEVVKKLDKAREEFESVLSPEEMKIVDKKIQIFKNTLSSANALEGEPMIRKLTEFSLGSATTDVLFTGAGSLAVAGYQIFSADGKEEKYSKSLTQGIPLVGGLMTMFYGAAKMWAGPFAIMAGIGAGKLFSILGDFADKGRKSYEEKQSLIKVALDAYNKSSLLNDKTAETEETEDKKPSSSGEKSDEAQTCERQTTEKSA